MSNVLSLPTKLRRRFIALVMKTKWVFVVAFMVLTSPISALAQHNCANGIRVGGTMTDPTPTGAVIPVAQVRTSGGEKTTTNAAGDYVLSCVPRTSALIKAQADEFADGTAQIFVQSAGKSNIDIQLTRESP